ncbi:MAG: hypothetical protein Q4F79_04460 [Eubacteriales bacterium]|nr:hypothetical protein [Eubacteriales bacterium]
MRSPCSSCPHRETNVQCPNQNYRKCSRWRRWFRQHWRGIAAGSAIRAAQIDYARDIAQMNRLVSTEEKRAQRDGHPN